MNIKNPKTQELTRRLSALTGESLTTAITTAVSERLARVEAGAEAKDPHRRAEQILAIGRDIAPRLTGPYAERDHGDLLYDELGLPT